MNATVVSFNRQPPPPPPSFPIHKRPSTSIAPISNTTFFNSSTKRQTRHTTYHSLARNVFEEIPVRDVFTWNNLIHSRLSQNDFHSVFSIYHQMLLRGALPDRRTIPRLLTASRLAKNQCLGKQVHAQALKLGFFYDHYIITALIAFYGSLVGVEAAKWVFDKSTCKNSVSWTVLGRLYLDLNKPDLAIETFYQMVDLDVPIDPLALSTAARACSLLQSLHHARTIYEIAKKCGLDSDVFVGNALLRMYVDCDDVEAAREIFYQMPSKNVISWTEIIRGYVRKGGFNEALKLFRQMVVGGTPPDALMISSILPACARMSALKNGKEIHGYLIRNGMDSNPVVQNSVLDMYTKSGLIEYASTIFERMKNRDAISWTAMIQGLGLHGKGEQGVRLLQNMEEQSVNIDQFTYAALLYCCVSAGIVEEGKYYFNRLREPTVRNYAQMVVLLARAALFDEARAFIREHQIERHGEVLRALLDGYCVHQQESLCKQVVEQLCDLEPFNAENYVLLSNLYAQNAEWEMVEKIEKRIRDMKLTPMRAYSWIEFDNKIHAFGTGDESHPRSEEIYWRSQSLMNKVEGEGYKLTSTSRLRDAYGERECIQTKHGEMLAVSFGLITTKPGAPIRVTKNVRICNSCHEYLKTISKIVEREIITKDPYCFHHFRGGTCSCKDFW